MEIIPVLDLKGGLVVRARAGDRASYAPIVTPLSPSPRAGDVATGLMRLADFRRLYIADLDAIAGGDGNDRIVDELADLFPTVELWVDNGLNRPETCSRWLAAHRARLVIGSESQVDTGLAKALGGGAILSIDYQGDRFQGPAALETDGSLWPEDVIVMTLAKVGTGAGPDLEKLAAARSRSGTARLWAAGGVRDIADLRRLADDGVAGALMATALHDGRLGPAELAELAAIGQ